MIMSHPEIEAMFAESGIYTDPDHHEYIELKKRQHLDTPFLEYDIDPVHVYADGVIYATISRVTARLFTRMKEEDSTFRIRGILKEHGIKYREESELVSSEMIWLTTFTMEV